MVALGGGAGGTVDQATLMQLLGQSGGSAQSAEGSLAQLQLASMGGAMQMAGAQQMDAAALQQLLAGNTQQLDAAALQQQQLRMAGGSPTQPGPYTPQTHESARFSGSGATTCPTSGNAPDVGAPSAESDVKQGRNQMTCE